MDALLSLGEKPSQYIRNSEESHGGRRFSDLDNLGQVFIKTVKLSKIFEASCISVGKTEGV